MKPAWQPGRSELIKSWGIEQITERLLQVALDDCGNKDLCIDELHVIRLSRHSGSQKYNIVDGIHRINVAKDSGLPGVIAWVSDCKPADYPEDCDATG